MLKSVLQLIPQKGKLIKIAVKRKAGKSVCGISSHMPSSLCSGNNRDVGTAHVESGAVAWSCQLLK